MSFFAILFLSPADWLVVVLLTALLELNLKLIKTCTMKSIDILSETNLKTIYKSLLGDYKVKLLDVTFAVTRPFSIRILRCLKSDVEENVKNI
jgi:hypothetical protein